MSFFVAVTPPAEFQRRLSEVFPPLGAEPHITVKAQAGLDPASRDVWWPAIETVASATAPLEVALGGLGTFGDQVLYLAVESPGLVVLHTALMKALARTPQEARASFEGADWVPHLTLMQGHGLHAEDFTDAARDLLHQPHFTCRSLILFGEHRQGYRRVHELPFGG